MLLLTASFRRPPRFLACSRRTVFSLPNLSSLSNGNSKTQHYFEQKVLPYSRQQLYDIVSDVGSYPKFIPFCLDAKIIGVPRQIPQSDPDSSEGPTLKMSAQLTVGFPPFEEKYTSEVTCTPHKTVKAVASSSTTLFKELTTLWRFEPASATPSSTDPSVTGPPSPRVNGLECSLVSLDLRYAFANPIHAAVSAGFFGQASKLMVKAFEDRCCEIYGHNDR